jgi:hypothetical protein
MKLRLVFFLLLGGLAPVCAQTSSPLGLPAAPTFSSCSYSCNSQYLSCVNPCSTAAGAAAGTASSTSSPSNTSQCYLNCTTQRQSCTLGCSGLPFD